MSFFYLLILSYILSLSSTALACLVGAALDDPKLGYQLMPVVYIPQLLLSGFFVNTELIPPFVRYVFFSIQLS